LGETSCIALRAVLIVDSLINFWFVSLTANGHKMVTSAECHSIPYCVFSFKSLIRWHRI